MKEVVKSMPPPPEIKQVEIAECTNIYFYGAKTDRGTLCIVTKSDFYRPDTYRAVVATNITIGDFVCSAEDKSLHKCLNGLINQNARVFQFNSSKELYQWLVKEMS